MLKISHEDSCLHDGVSLRPPLGFAQILTSSTCIEIDTLFEPSRRFEVEGLLNQTAHPYQVALYSGTFHGFGTRANISVPEQKFGKEEAFFQAVRWFKTW